MTRYLTEYISYIKKRLEDCSDAEELEEIFAEHKNKIAFMQHERIVHFLVTMMFAIILVIFVIGLLLTDNIALTILIIIILALLGAYIKHYYFLENTVQSMYVIYDDMLKKRNNLKGCVQADQKENSSSCL